MQEAAQVQSRVAELVHIDTRFLERCDWDFVGEATFPPQVGLHLFGGIVAGLQKSVAAGYLNDVFWVVWAEDEDRFHLTALISDGGMHEDGGRSWWRSITRNYGTGTSPYPACKGFWQWFGCGAVPGIVDCGGGDWRFRADSITDEDRGVAAA